MWVIPQRRDALAMRRERPFNTFGTNGIKLTPEPAPRLESLTVFEGVGAKKVGRSVRFENQWRVVLEEHKRAWQGICTGEHLVIAEFWNTMTMGTRYTGRVVTTVMRSWGPYKSKRLVSKWL